MLEISMPGGTMVGLLLSLVRRKLADSSL